MSDMAVNSSVDTCDPEPMPAHHRLVALPTDDAPRLGQPNYLYNRGLTDALQAGGLPRPNWETVSSLPSRPSRSSEMARRSTRPGFFA